MSVDAGLFSRVRSLAAAQEGFLLLEAMFAALVIAVGCWQWWGRSTAPAS
jgi:hypothetical protein